MVIIIILVGPTIRDQAQFPDKRTLVHMSSTSFLCIVNGVPPPEITWFRGDQQLHVTTRISITTQPSGLTDPAINSTLTLHMLTNKDNGHYWCKAENKLASVDSKQGYELIVMDPGNK